MNKNFIRISAYNRYDHSTIVPAYINIKYITSLDEIKDSDETLYILYLIDGSYRITKDSYDYIIKIVTEGGCQNA